jgi:hypothetical protein
MRSACLSIRTSPMCSSPWTWRRRWFSAFMSAESPQFTRARRLRANAFAERAEGMETLGEEHLTRVNIVHFSLRRRARGCERLGPRVGAPPPLLDPSPGRHDRPLKSHHIRRGPGRCYTRSEGCSVGCRCRTGHPTTICCTRSVPAVSSHVRRGPAVGTIVLHQRLAEPMVAEPVKGGQRAPMVLASYQAEEPHAPRGRPGSSGIPACYLTRLSHDLASSHVRVDRRH